MSLRKNKKFLKGIEVFDLSRAFNNEEDFQSWIKENFSYLSGKGISIKQIDAKVSGVVGLLWRAETLYKQDKKFEALDLIDSYLKFPKKSNTQEWLEAVLDRLQVLSKEKGEVKEKNDQSYEMSMDSNLRLVAAVIELRAQCFIAILDRYRVSKELWLTALRNALLMETIGDKEPRFLIFAAQTFALCGDLDKAIELLDQALMLDPNNIHAIYL